MVEGQLSADILTFSAEQTLKVSFILNALLVQSVSSKPVQPILLEEQPGTDIFTNASRVWMLEYHYRICG